MTNESTASAAGADTLYFQLFDALPGNSVLIKNDEPRFTILAATPGYLKQTGLAKEAMIGKGIFETFPANRSDPNCTDKTDLYASYQHVLRCKEPHFLPVRRYDLKHDDGSFSERYWKAGNTPVLTPAGEVAYIIHTAEDITPHVKAQERTLQMKGIEQAHNMFLQAPFVIGIFRGKDHIIELANEDALKFWGKTEAIIGKPLLEAIPELKAQEVYEKIDRVFKTGRLYQATEVAITSVKDGNEAVGYFDLYYKPYYDEGSPTVSGVFTVSNEVTQKVLAQKKVAESERNLRNMILQSPVAMAILRGSGFVVELANDRMYELWGRGEEELLGKSIFTGLPEVREQGYEELLTGVFTTGERFTALGIPVTLPREDRIETVYINLLYEAFRAADGTITGVMAVASNVTEQVLARKRIEENESDLQRRVEERTADLARQKGFIGSILNASLSGIYALKAVRNAEGKVTDFQYLFANDNIASVFNLGAGEMVGASMLQLIPENRTNGFFDLFCHTLQSGETVHDVTHFVTESIDRWYDFVLVPVDEETVVVTTQDITEQKRSSLRIEEQRNLLDSILRHSSNGISVSQVFRDESGQVMDALTLIANDAAVKFMGLPKEVILTKRATEIEPNIIGSAYYRQCIKTLDTGEPFLMQYQMESTRRWLELTVSKLDENHLIQIFTDVTAIKDAQLRLEKSVEDLKRSNQNLEEFAYAASHDLKEPIRKIQLFSDRLRERLSGRLESEDEMLFGRVLNAAQRMGTLIDDLLLYSHVSRGSLLEETIDLKRKVTLVLEDLEVEIEEKKAVVTVGTLPTVKGHRRQLQQVFHNLITNALKYAKAGVPPDIKIDARLVSGGDKGLPVTDESGGQFYHLIEVKDNGIGFAPENADLIFNVFTRLHGNAEYKGTGVGLSIVRRVIENHGGYVWAESQAGEGATFKVLLPAM